MNEPIISPWLIYWAGRIGFIQIICCVVGLVVTALAVSVAMVVLTDDYEHDESVRALKILVCAAFILDTLAVFLPTKTALYLQDVAELVKDTYPLNISKLSSLLDQYTAIKQKHSSRVTSRMPQLFIRMLLEWHMYHYADNVPVDKSQLVYISRFMDYKRRIVEMLIDTGKIHIVTPFVGYDFYIINHLREKWEETHPKLNRQNRILYTAVKAYKVGVDIPVTDVDADLPLLEKVAVDNGKLEDVYGVYGNGCIGINKRENCKMLQKSLVKVVHGDKKSLEKVEEVRKWSKKQLLKKSIQLLSAVKHFPDAQWCINVQCVNQDL